MPVSLKDALHLHEGAKKSKQEEEEAEVQSAVQHIDEFITLHIDTLMQKPIVYRTTKFPSRILAEAVTRYTDFTVFFSYSTGGITIKLADKDWDWQGYGVKVEDTQQDTPAREESFWTKWWKR